MVEIKPDAPVYAVSHFSDVLPIWLELGRYAFGLSFYFRRAGRNQFPCYLASQGDTGKRKENAGGY